ncbi:MAG: bacillithiol biosynthesis cysteine-adding enzyme BshC [Acidobacteria bacterium]|nr:bacillithiol biosynthesis cysteine-adding enzyme BshC [Acidobacteriota bacterium]MDA1234368.1 bacillithiol biosynthesis cysteine-adding enzyme BshC [Acidobacteriota bacterium]
MKVARIPYTSLPGTTPLFADLLYNFERVAKFYPHQPSLDSVAAAVAGIAYPDERRSRVVAALREQNRSAGDATQENLNRLARPETVVVATGQQVGLFGGPIFSVFKALTAAKHAADLRQRGISAVAVFWLATEDHDLAEVDHAWLFDADGEPRLAEGKAQLAESAPVGAAKLPSGVTDALRKAVAGMPNGEAVLRNESEHYKEGRTLGQAFRGLLEDLLKPHGLIFLDPMDSALRPIAAELIRKLIDRGDQAVDLLTTRGKQLDDAGYHRQVAVGSGSSLLFRVSDGRRSVIRRSGDRYLTEDGAKSATELGAMIERDPEGFSPNALLRPVVQDYLLPTAVFVGGAAELAYLAQSAVLYDLLLGRMPVVMPRAGFTLLNGRAAKLMERYQLDVPGCFIPLNELQDHIARRATPAELQQRFDSEGAVIGAALDRINETLTSFDPTLGEAFQRSSSKINYQLAKIQTKAARESLLRNERSRGDANRLANLIYPQKTLQERLYCTLPFLAQYGDELLDRVYEAIDSGCLDHQVITI